MSKWLRQRQSGDEVAQLARKPRLFYGWVVMIALIGTMLFGSGVPWYAMGVFFEPLVTHFGWSRGQYALAISVFFSCGALLSPVVGRIIDVYGARRVMLIGAAISGILWCLVSQVGLFWPATALYQLYIIYGILAISEASLGFVATSKVISSWFIKRRGLALGISITGFGLPGFILVPLSAPLLDAYGWRPLGIVLGVMLWLCVIPIVFFFIKNKPADVGLLPDGVIPVPAAATSDPTAAEVAVEEDIEKLGFTLRQALAMISFWAIGMTYFFVNFGSVAVQMNAIPFLMDRGYSRALASTMWGTLAFTGIVGKVIGGQATDWISAKWVLILSIGLQVAAIAIVLSSPSALAAWAFAIIFGLGMGAQFLCEPVLVGQCFGLLAYGTILGSIVFFTMPGRAIGQPVAGFLFDATGSYTLPYIIFIGTYVLGMLLVFFLVRPPKEAPWIKAKVATH